LAQLPAEPRSAILSGVEKGDRGMALSGKRVLVVEDESLVSMLIEEFLEDIGCTVAGVAGRIEEAARLAESLAVDLAVLDVNLDGTPSYRVAETLGRRGIPFVLATGYGGGALPAALQAAHVLTKPFTRDQLEAALAAASDGRPG
jgi:CheY-like chemotaxis protein